MALRSASHRRGSAASSECSYGSAQTRSTAPTEHSDVKPTLRHFETDISQLKRGSQWEDEAYYDDICSRYSVEDYASTIASQEDLDVDDDVYHAPPDYAHEYEAYIPTAQPSSPAEFAGYFPSTRRLCIRHDDSVDGNMNLRVDTAAETESGRRVDLTLFHLRMHDLKRREFSFRRYCRDSGREVCHSVRKYNTAATKRRPAFQRSVSNALASLRSMTLSDKSSIKGIKRQDSGYASMFGDGPDPDLDEEFPTSDALPQPSTAQQFAAKNLPIPTNTTLLEFSNYAHVELKRRGAKASKRYEFAYWGTDYSWRRAVAKHADGARSTAYHLVRTGTTQPLAHIVPEPRSPSEIEDEERRGGWVPPCAMWIADERLVAGDNKGDVADVIVATGILALVDDCIKNKWHRRDRLTFSNPLALYYPALSPNSASPAAPAITTTASTRGTSGTSGAMGHRDMSSPVKASPHVEFVNPKRFLDEMLGRRPYSSPSPLRKAASGY